MDELDKAMEVALKGSVAEEALRHERRQMRAWGVTMPPGQALVLDFGLGRFDEIGEIEHWIANEIDQGYCGKFLFLQDGQTCPVHHHKEKHETFFIVKGSALFVLDGVEHRLWEGDVLCVGQGCNHRFTGLGPVLILEISKPCLLADNYFDDSDITVDGAPEDQRRYAAHRSESIRRSRRQGRVASEAKPLDKPADGSR